MELLTLAAVYPLANRADGNLREAGEVSHPHDVTHFINERAGGSCCAACQLFHEQTIRNAIDRGRYVPVPFQVINDQQNNKRGFPRSNFQEKHGPHAHWCVIAGYATRESSPLLAKQWGENRLFDINDLGNSIKDSILTSRPPSSQPSAPPECSCCRTGSLPSCRPRLPQSEEATTADPEDDSLALLQ